MKSTLGDANGAGFDYLRIPKDSGRVFRRKAATIPSEAGHRTDGKAAAYEAVVGKVAGMARKIAG